MVHILDGSLVYDVYMWIELDNLIYLRQSFTSVSNLLVTQNNEGKKRNKQQILFLKDRRKI